MTVDLTTEVLIDRVAISDVVIKYATALDKRDWSLLRSILCDKVWVDYRTFDPELNLEMDADEWVNRVKGLAGFDATQHLSSNHVHSIEGDTAVCVSYMQAGHFLKRDDGEHFCFLYGHYTSEMTRTETGWKIHKVTLEITASQGDHRVFEWAFSSVGY